ncbi:MAG: hypothetical protein Ct9H300mP12_05640 [Acidimicrobiales bacterium]|nr:MAG: hypothetical protein Ct9H300mP12_05640 [Acidimicrobiales bacterium]
MRTRLVLLIVACIVAGACSDDAGPERAAPTTTAVPTSTYDVDEAMDGVREDVVRLVMERDGLDRAAAGVSVPTNSWSAAWTPRLSTSSSPFRQLDGQSPVAPRPGSTLDRGRSRVCGGHHDPGRGDRPDRCAHERRLGGWNGRADALSLVQPVGYCTDLLALMKTDMVDLGVPQDPDCLLAGVGEEDVAKWFVALFMHGREGFNAAMGEDLDLTCPAGS